MMHFLPERDSALTEVHLALILDKQHQVISGAQARAAGLTEEQVRWKVKSGRWQCRYRGTYATFSGPLTRQARLWAVVLRAGGRAALSHQSAAEVLGLAGPGRGESEPIHVTVPVQSNPERYKDLDGVVVHRNSNWRGYEAELLDLPCTPIVMTVLDLVDSAATLDDAYDWLSRAVTSCNLPSEQIAAQLAERKKFARRAWLSDALADIGEGIHFPLERRWARDVERAHGLPRATRQARRYGPDGSRRLDNFYEPYRLCVELDGAAFQRAEDLDLNRRRDNETLIAADAKTLRYGFNEVANHPCDQAEQFARALIRQGWPAGPLKPCEPGCPVASLGGGEVQG
ncbi:MAG TPA: type IV toxin-antitoxin system AbiEi family antitoxin domain-containing protein [Trebonia sp.]|nr:type IV toxin-antitoxin system AbiEi family antitoxin domain-containing protein [Trebonia sp.]